jgi:branched-chain amino acid transport system substrate-binding protein
MPLLAAKAGGAQVIMPMFDMPESGILIMQHRAMKIPSLLAGFISPAMGEGAWEAIGEDLEGMINVVFEAGNIPIEAIPESVAFFEAYRERWGVLESGHAPAPSWDSVFLLAEAIERAGTLDPDALVREIKATDMKGAIGRIRFDYDHQAIYGLDPKEAALAVVFQWQDGVRVPVFPEAVAEGIIRLPPWME